MRLSESEYLAILARTGQALPPETREQQWQAQVVRVAKELGLLVHHHYDSRRSEPGWPDLAIVDPRPGPGTLWLVECKTDRGKLSHAQEIWLRSLHGKTVVAETWRPGGIGEIVAKLRGQA